MHFNGLWQVPAARALCVCVSLCLSPEPSPLPARAGDEMRHLMMEGRKSAVTVAGSASHRGMLTGVTWCLNLLCWAGVQPELTLPRIPVPRCPSEPLTPAGRRAGSACPCSEGCCATRSCSLSWPRLLLCVGMFYKPVVVLTDHILCDVFSREPWLHHTPAQSGAQWVGTLLQAEQTQHKSSALSQIQTIEMKLLKWLRWHGDLAHSVLWVYQKCRDSLAASWSFFLSLWHQHRCKSRITDIGVNWMISSRLDRQTSWHIPDGWGFFPTFGNTKCCLFGLFPPFFITILRVTLW